MKLVVDNTKKRPEAKMLKLGRTSWRVFKGGIYHRPNLVFASKVCEAISYNWWTVVKKIKGKVVFNTYKFSKTTSIQQRQMRDLLQHLEIGIDYEIEAPEGLEQLKTAINYYESKIAKGKEVEQSKAKLKICRKLAK